MTPLRCLVIGDDPVYRRLLRQHVITALDGAEVAEHDSQRDGRLAREFTAAGFDVVLLDHRPAGEDALEWLADFGNRPMFPPTICLLAEPYAEAESRVLERGAFGVLARRKVDAPRLARLLDDASRRRRAALQEFRLTPAAEKLYRFGQVVIKGERCIRALASSAISNVYLAESEREGRLVCLKVLHQVPDLTDKASPFERFIQEYQIIAGIRHPNVVQIYDLGVADDHAYIAMEYFPAGDLRSRIRRGLRPQEALGILRQVAEALGAIHAVGVLHRDLKPGNVMLRPDGTIALIDFGLAKQLELEAEITATGEIFGTPYYMSPVQGHGREVDASSDLYSLGVIFWEMLTGTKPFLAPTPMAVIYKHSHAPIPELPAALAAWQPLLARLLAKEPGDRYRSARELVAAIDALPPLAESAA
ncbi:MAG: protein kinase domain-containing protein [Pseudomonadota bacterium]